MLLFIAFLIVVCLTALGWYHSRDIFSPFFLVPGVWAGILLLYYIAQPDYYPIRHDFPVALVLWVTGFLSAAWAVYYLLPERHGLISDNIILGDDVRPNRTVINAYMVISLLVMPYMLYALVRRLGGSRLNAAAGAVLYGLSVIGLSTMVMIRMYVLLTLLTVVLAFFIALYAFKAPDSQLVFWFSMIPFTSPIVMLARIPFSVPMWQLVLSIVLLIGTFVACAWASAKIYKVGILMYGKKSTFKDLLKWLKMK